MSDIRFLRFEELTPQLLYDILAMRQRVFQVEQQRYYLDTDGKDQVALHGLVEDGGNLIGYLRILPPGVTYPTAAIGRVAIEKPHRGKGIGQALMKAALEAIEDCWPQSGVTLSAQLPTIPFYERLGFKTVGESYMEAGIKHIKMTHQPH